MSEKTSRRDFLKLASVGAATAAVLTGCGPASRYVTREPYIKMPEYNYNGLSTYYATTCRECAAGCGLIVRTMQGRAIKVEGNPENPVNRGKTCARGQTTLQGLYNPNRVRGPIKHKRGEALYNAEFQDVEANASWDDAIQAVAEALKNPAEVAFLLGPTSDHLFDLVSDLTTAIGCLCSDSIWECVRGPCDTEQGCRRSSSGQAGMPLLISRSQTGASFGATSWDVVSR